MVFPLFFGGVEERRFSFITTEKKVVYNTELLQERRLGKTEAFTHMEFTTRYIALAVFYNNS